jgi:hypothetical protein
MKDFVEATLLSPLLFTFLIPGLTLTLLLIPKKKIALTLLLTYVVVLGFFSQLIIGLIASFSGQLVNDSILNINLVSLLFISSLLITLFKTQKDKLKNLKNLIQISSYDVAVIILMTIVTALFLSNIRAMDGPYFNAATDQYIWFGEAEHLLENPVPTFIRNIHPFSVYKHSFSYILATFIPFVEKNLTDYQNLIVFWSGLFYSLLVLIGAQLGRSIFKSSALGLLVPLLILSFHWDNYYLIAAAVVPQNIGLLLFMFGFILLNHLHDWKDQPKRGVILSIIYLSLFYLIHSPSLMIFLLSVGVANILIFILSFISKQLGRKPIRQKLTFLSIPAIPITIIVAVRYFLYYTRILSHNDPSTIYGYSNYLKPLSLWSDPYLTWHETAIIWMAIIGFIIITIKIFRNKKIYSAVFLLGSFILLLWIFNTLELTYFVIYASWQAFRFKLFIYPALAVGAVVTIHFLLSLFKKHSFVAYKLLTIIFIVIAIPQLLFKINSHQSLVILDMISGRDKATKEIYQTQLKELLAAKSYLPQNDKATILFVGKNISTTYGLWVFAPQEFYVSHNCLAYDQCMASNRINNKRASLSGADADLVILEKDSELIKNLSGRLIKQFANQKESSQFLFYYD